MDGKRAQNVYMSYKAQKKLEKKKIFLRLGVLFGVRQKERGGWKKPEGMCQRTHHTIGSERERERNRELEVGRVREKQLLKKFF